MVCLRLRAQASCVAGAWRPGQVPVCLATGCEGAGHHQLAHGEVEQVGGAGCVVLRVTRWCRQVATWRGYRVPPGSVLVTTCHPGHVLAGDRDVVLSGGGAFETISKYFYL